MSTVWIRVVYGIVVAALLAMTVIYGIGMVSTGPKPPGIPDITPDQLFQQQSGDSGQGQNRIVQNATRFYNDATTYRERLPGYRRNVFLAAAGFGILWVLIGLALPMVTNYLRWGFVLGGLFLFVYGFIVLNQAIPDPPIVGDLPLSLLTAGRPGPLDFPSRFALFAVPFIGLILTLFLGLWRLTEWSSGGRRVVATTRPVAAPAMAAAPASSQWAPPPSSVPAPAPTPVPAPPPAPTPVPVATAVSEATVVEPRDAEPQPTTEWRRPE
ncbi:MAG: hypothetical protein HYX51_00385 [Chloroflexi bacterium]|nr:hypothetical protein [Chloroflexota bacterium]